jgi:hypothetical protein
VQFRKAARYATLFLDFKQRNESLPFSSTIRFTILTYECECGVTATTRRSSTTPRLRRSASQVPGDRFLDHRCPTRSTYSSSGTSSGCGVPFLILRLWYPCTQVLLGAEVKPQSPRGGDLRWQRRYPLRKPRHGPGPLGF